MMDVLDLNKKKNRGMYKNLALVTQVGLNVIIPILLGVYIGTKLDRIFNKKMLFTMTLMILGALSGFMNLFKLAGKPKAKDEDDEEDSENNDKKK